MRREEHQGVPRPHRPRRFALASAVAATSLLLSSALGTPALAQDGGAGVGEIVGNVGGYYGKTVTVTGNVANIIDPFHGAAEPIGFTIADGAEGQGRALDELLIIPAPTVALGGGMPDLTAQDRVRVAGAVVVFNRAEVERTTGVRLDAQAFQEWDGRPAIVAWDIDSVALSAARARPAEEKRPATVNLVTAWPASFYGKVVTVGGEVVEVFDPAQGMLGPVAMTIAADGRLDATANHETLLVIRAPVAAMANPMADFAPGSWVSVHGPVVAFNVAEVEQATGLDLDNQLLQRWDGKPAVIAWTVQGAS